MQFGEHRLTLDAGVLGRRPELASHDGKDVIIGMRPEHFVDDPDGRPESTLTTVCKLRESLGSEMLLHFPVSGDTSDEMFVARVHAQSRARGRAAVAERRHGAHALLRP